MTDEDYERVKSYAERWSLRPHPPLHKGIGVDVIVDNSCERPEFGSEKLGERKFIRLSQADVDDINERVKRKHDLHSFELPD